MNISIEPLDVNNWLKVCELSVSEAQKQIFAVPNLYWIGISRYWNIPMKGATGTEKCSWNTRGGMPPGSDSRSFTLPPTISAITKKTVSARWG
jgi:hypothetical protein